MRQGSPPRPLPVWILMYPEVQVLDVTGPLEVFALANRLSPGRVPRYEISVLAPEAGAVSTSSGLSLVAARVEGARRLLETAEASVSEVAAACGFARVETMHRAFRRGVRVTPGQYRRHFRAVS